MSAISDFVGLAVPIVISRNSCLESAETTAVRNSRARLMATCVLPTAVGPAMTISFLASITVQFRISRLYFTGREKGNNLQISCIFARRKYDYDQVHQSIPYQTGRSDCRI